MRSNFIRCCIALTAIVFSNFAQAHPGHANGLAAGLAHPLLGLDHLLAMLAVGVWAAQLGARARWLVPTGFVTLMTLAGGLALSGNALPMLAGEGAIAASVLLLGLLIAFAVRMTPAVGAALVGAFAVFHGYAHGAEMPPAATAWQYAAGFVLSTVALHGAGLLLGRRLHEHGLALRATGALIAAGGAWLMAAV